MLPGAPSEPAPSVRRTIGESALTERLAAPLRGISSCCVKASSPIVRCMLGAGSERAPGSLCGG
eukprot:13853084-Alexandrium_andersonii.AAC.1